MEAALRSQATRVEELRKIVRNYAKDSGNTRRNNSEYYRKKLADLDKWWVCFDDANTDLTQYEIEEEQPYVKNKVYNEASKHYLNHRGILEKGLEKYVEKEKTEQEEKNNNNGKKMAFNEKYFEDWPSTSATLSGDSTSEESGGENDLVENEEQPEVEVLKYLFMEVKQAIKIAKNVRNATHSPGVATIQLENLKSAWTEFKLAYRTVALSANKLKCRTINYERLQEQILDLSASMADIINNSKGTANAQLPKIKLPEFDGNPTLWQSFKDIFDKIIHQNKSINDSIKMEYLKTCLKGQALNLVSHVPPNADSYKTCYEILTQRYENKREIINILLDKILNLPVQHTEKSNGIREIHDITYECIMAIKNMGVSTQNWDILIVHILLKKLNEKTIMDYESKLENVKEVQTLDYFFKYLEKRFLTLTSVENKSSSIEKYKEKYESFTTFSCNYCKTMNKVEKHSIYKCKEFLKLEPKQRSEWAKNNKSCYVCLQQHKPNECKGRYNCKVCDKQHNTLLHIESKKQHALCATTEENSAINVDDYEIGEPSQINALVVNKSNSALIATAIVSVVSGTGEKYFLRALIDPGSQSAFITEEATQLLKLQRKKISAQISGIGNTTKIAKNCVTVTIHSRLNEQFCMTTEAIVLEKITSFNVQPGVVTQYDHLKNLKLADTAETSKIDILLGVVEYAKIIKTGIIKSEKQNEPIAQNSELGWLVCGSVNLTGKKKVVTLISNVEIEKRIEEFFTAEDLEDVSEDEKFTKEEKECEEYYKKTTKRDKNGVFTVSMPFKNNEEPKLGESKKRAMATLYSLEKRFEKSPKLHELYIDAMRDQIKRGHMEEVKDVPENAYYIPHHAVFKNSSTTKLRTVYNASQKTTNGMGLNEQLAIGKISQASILDLILKGRQYKIAIIGDIEKMYKMIKLDKEQQHLQMILWREKSKEKIKVYKITRVMFGLAPSPYLAIRTLKELAKLIEKTYPIASKAIRKNFYVDDYNGGANTIEEAKHIYVELKNGLKEGGFNIRKFASNSKELMENIPEIDKEGTEKIITTLGIKWNIETDELMYSCNIRLEETPRTKRELFAEISTLYDPLGLITPIVIKARILMQSIWNLKINGKKLDWDDVLPREIVKKWMKIKGEFGCIEELKIPRWIDTSKNSKVEIHGFCDASELAYAAVVYVRHMNESGKNIIKLLIAKSRVAPIKNTLSIPKLELMGAVLLSKLVKKVIKTMEIKVEKTYLWTDSQITLAWIKGNPKKWNTFVANRVVEISNKTNKDDWYQIMHQGGYMRMN